MTDANNSLQKNRKWAWLMVLLFFIWGGISYGWYTCGIKNFCDEDTVHITIGGDTFITVENTQESDMSLNDDK